MSGLYDVTLAAGAAGNIAALGALVKVSSAPAGAVTLKLDGGEAFTLLEGQGVRLPDGKLFRDVQVINRAGSSQTVSLFIGDSRFEDTRITGTVSVVDAGKSRTLAGGAFMGRMSQTIGGAAYQGIQLWMPAAANVRAVVESVSFLCSVAANLYFSITSTTQTTFAQAISKKGGGAQSVAALQAGSSAVFGTFVVNPFYQIANTASTLYTYTFKEPVVLPPGYGLLIASDSFVAASTCAAIFEFFEEANT